MASKPHLVVPTILATTPDDYAARLHRVQPFASRLHVDICDGAFVNIRTVGLTQIYTPDGVPFDLHLMVNHPERQTETILSLHPTLVIIHYEAPANHSAFFQELHSLGIRTGLAILPDTTTNQVQALLPDLDHLLVFTGTLGHNHGEFQPHCLDKIAQARAMKPSLEIAVDGGITDQTAPKALQAGADVLNVGSFIHDAPDPRAAYTALQTVAIPMA